MPLTDSIARIAKPAAKTIRIFDHDCLYLEVSPRLASIALPRSQKGS